MARDLRTPVIPIIALVLFALGAGHAPLLAPARAQDAEPAPKPETPPQTGLSPFTAPFEHREEPAFAIALPKGKKFDAVRERWRVVDLAVRKGEEIQKIEEALAAEQAKEPKDDQRIIELQSAKAQAERWYARAKFQLEVDGKRAEWLRIDLTTLSDRKATIAKLDQRKYLETKWSKVQVLRDEETTTKAQKNKGQQAHTLILYGTPEKEKDHGWWRIETRLIPSKDDQQLFQIQWIHHMPAASYDKESAKEDELLAQMFLVP